MRQHHQEADLESPLLFVSFDPTHGEVDTVLPHDGHPNRVGYAFAANLYAHELLRRGWLPGDAGELPPLHPNQTAGRRAFSAERLRRLRAEVVTEQLDTDMDFAAISDEQTLTFLGGIFPSSPGSRAFPHASVEAGFLLRRDPSCTTVSVEIEVEPRHELYPLALELVLDGQRAGELRLDDVGSAGRHTIEGRLRAPPASPTELEVVLRTSSYFTRLDDPTMRSYVLLRATQR